MKQTEQHIAWIDHFLNDECTPEERAAFQEKVSQNTSLSTDLSLVADIADALADQQVLALQQTLQKIEAEAAIKTTTTPATTLSHQSKLAFLYQSITTIQTTSLKGIKTWLSFLHPNRTHFRRSIYQVFLAASVVLLLFVFLFKSNLLYDHNPSRQKNSLADSSQYQNNRNYSIINNPSPLHQVNPSSTIKIKEQNGVLDNTPQLIAIEIWLEKRCC